MNTNLPDKKYFEYVSHLTTTRILSSLENWISSNFEYPLHELKKFNTLLVDNQNYIKNNRILDLGCSNGFISFIAKHLGATSVTGLNIRAEPIKIAEYFFNQTNTIGNFVVGDIEDFNLLEKLCNDADTVILSSILEHLRNPEYIIRTITNSNIQNILIENTIVEDSADGAKLYYYTQDSNFEYNAFDNYYSKDKVLGSCPNQRFLEEILYYHGWQITNYVKYDSFSADWFAIKNLDMTPLLRKIVVIAATKFK
jgi:SAM-dependent methyltransferase